MSRWIYHTIVPWMPFRYPPWNKQKAPGFHGWLGSMEFPFGFRPHVEVQNAVSFMEGKNLRNKTSISQQAKRTNTPLAFRPNKSNPTPRIVIWSCQQDISTCTCMGIFRSFRNPVKHAPTWRKTNGPRPLENGWLGDLDPHVRRRIVSFGEVPKGLYIYIYELSPKFNCCKMEYLFILRFKGPLRFSMFGTRVSFKQFWLCLFLNGLRDFGCRAPFWKPCTFACVPARLS